MAVDISIEPYRRVVNEFSLTSAFTKYALRKRTSQIGHPTESSSPPHNYILRVRGAIKDRVNGEGLVPKGLGPRLLRRLRTTPMPVRGNRPRLAVMCGAVSSRSITG